MRAAGFLCIQAALLLVPITGNASPFAGSAVVSDAELGQMRGGFTLPNGVEVAMAVEIQTSVNGRSLLRSVFAVNEGVSELAVYASGGEAPVRTSGGGVANVSVSVDPVNGDTRIATVPARESGVSIGQAAATVGGGAPAQPAVPTESSPAPLPVAPGDMVVTADGAVSIRPDGQRVTMATETLQIQHLVGRAFGTIISNAGSGRVIDSNTVVNLSLGNATPDRIGSSLLRASDAVLDAVRGINR